MLVFADSVASAAIPVAIGAFLGAVGSVIFLMRARGFEKMEAEAFATGEKAGGVLVQDVRGVHND